MTVVRTPPKILVGLDFDFSPSAQTPIYNNLDGNPDIISDQQRRESVFPKQMKVKALVT